MSDAVRHPWRGPAGRVAGVAAAARSSLDGRWLAGASDRDHPDNDALVSAALSWSASARPDLWRERSEFTNAVYVAFDQRGVCRYVGSVSRASTAAVAERLAEHFAGAGRFKRAGWARLFVVGLAPGLTLRQVRTVEARAALNLAPADGSAHPSRDYAETLPVVSD